MKPGLAATTALLAFTALFTVSLVTGTLAQQPGGIRAQGKDVNRDRQKTQPKRSTAASLVDARQEMRKLIRHISSVSRRANRNFVVITMGGL